MLLTLGNSTRGVRLGNEELSPDDLAHHVEMIGSTGCGKSEQDFDIFKQLCPMNCPIVSWDNKGDAAERKRDWAVSSGYASRVNYIDLASPDCPGLNLLLDNGLEISIQVEAARDAILMSGANFDFAAVPQMQRMLYMALYIARAANQDLLTALRALYPHAPERLELLHHIDDPFMHAMIRGFDELTQRKQDDLATPAIARLENTLNYRPLRRILSSRNSLDLKERLKENAIIIVRAPINRPIPKNKIQTIGRLFTQHLIYTINSLCPTYINQNHPCYFCVDEVQHIATPLLADCLDMGRGLGLNCIFIHQHLHQLMEEDKSGYLYYSILRNCRNKIVFGDYGYDDEAQLLAKMMFGDRFNAKKIKDEQWIPHHLPHETTRRQVTLTLSSQEGKDEHTGEQYSATLTRSNTTGEINTTSVLHAYMSGSGYSHMDSLSSGESENSAEKILKISGFLSDGEVTLPVMTASTGQHSGEGAADGYSDYSGYTDADGTAQSLVNTQTNGQGLQLGRNRTRGTNRGRGVSVSTVDVPFHEYETIWIPQRTYYTVEEQIWEWMVELNKPSLGCFHLKPYQRSTRYVVGKWNRPLLRFQSDIDKGMARMPQEPADELPEDQAPQPMNGHVNGHVNGQVNGHQRRFWEDETD